MNKPNWPPETLDPASAAGDLEPMTNGRPMPAEVIYHGWLGEAIASLTPTTEADPVAMLVTLMAVFGVMVGPGPHVRIHDDNHPALIWPFIMGRTGIGRKGMSWGAVKPVIRQADSDFYDLSVTSGLSSGEGLITALADDDDESKPRGGKSRVIVESEYSVTMARAGREGNTLGGVLRQAWEGDNLRILTKNSVRATRPHVAIVAHITPGEFCSRVKSAEMAGGTFNRYLPIYSERTKEIPEGDGAPQEMVVRIATELARRADKAKHVGHVGLTPAARTFWTDVVYSALSASSATDGVIAQFTARATAYARRIAMMYALADGAVIVDEKHMHSAYALVNYSRASAAYVLGSGTGDPSLDKLVVAADAAGEAGLTRTQVANDVFAKHMSKAQLDDLFAKFEKVPGVTRERRPTGGRPVDVWALVAEKAEEAKEALRPAERSSAAPAEKLRKKGQNSEPPTFLRTYSAPQADSELPGQDPCFASSAFSAPLRPEEPSEDFSLFDQDPPGDSRQYEV